MCGPCPPGSGSGAENAGSTANGKESLRPQESGTMAALGGNTRCHVNKQRMNGAVRKLEFGEGLLSRHFLAEGGSRDNSCASSEPRGEGTPQATGSPGSPGGGRDWNKLPWSLRLTYQGQELPRLQHDQGVDESQTPFAGVPKPSFYCFYFFHETRQHQGQREMEREGCSQPVDRDPFGDRTTLS